MKKLLTTILLLSFIYNYSQETKVVIDYVVDYEILNNQGVVSDTIKIGYSKSGKFLWTDYPTLGIEFTKDILKNNDSVNGNPETNILYNTNSTDVIFSLNYNGNVVFFKIDLKSFIPSSDSFDENVSLISEKTENKANILGNEHNIYRIYPNTEPDESIFIVYDENIPIDNNSIFSEFIKIALSATNSSGSIDTNLNNGLILSVNDGSKE